MFPPWKEIRMTYLEQLVSMDVVCSVHTPIDRTNTLATERLLHWSIRSIYRCWLDANMIRWHPKISTDNIELNFSDSKPMRSKLKKKHISFVSFVMRSINHCTLTCNRWRPKCLITSTFHVFVANGQVQWTKQSSEYHRNILFPINVADILTRCNR